MVHSDNKKAVKTAEIIILAVKPYNFADIIDEIKTTLDPKNMLLFLLSPAFGSNKFKKRSGKPVPVIRAMPNTAIAIQQSMTCLAHAGHLNHR
jgi:pyrroline-5-carboxylate reductase